MKKAKPTVEELTVIQAKAVLTVAEVAVMANICVGSLYKVWKAGGGPRSFKVGRARRVKRTALDTWITDLTRVR